MREGDVLSGMMHGACKQKAAQIGLRRGED